jgi:hypothetical protein
MLIAKKAAIRKNRNVIMKMARSSLIHESAKYPMNPIITNIGIKPAIP